MSLQIKNLNFAYPDKKILRNISINFIDGKIYGLIGAPNSGKSTLLKIMSGFLVPQKGDVLLNKKSIFKNYTQRKKIGFCPQEIRIFVLKNLEERIIKEGLSKKEARRIKKEFLNRFEIEKIRKKILKIKNCSKRKEIVLREILNKKYEVLILDEPENGLSNAKIKKIINAIKKNKSKIKIISSYHSLILNLCDKIFLLKDGKIFPII